MLENKKNLPQVKNIIAIASGKGGVGKSTTALNLALALQQNGFNTGILDADIYGPSVPTMLGKHLKPSITEDKKILPILAHGIQSISIGYLVDPKAAMAWRGPMATSALQQLLYDTVWDNLDFLIIDLPPGTGDIQLSLAQKIPLTGVVVVTTPQDLALIDARRACDMFRKMHVPVLGVIENMSMHVCSQCGHAEAIFGEGGGKIIATECEVELLGSLPLDKFIREQTDSGNPTLVADKDGVNAQLYRDIAVRLVKKLSLQQEADSVKFPSIEIRND